MAQRKKPSIPDVPAIPDETLARAFPGGSTIRDEANALTAFAFRNGPIENLHAGEASPLTATPSLSRITDDEMRELMLNASRGAGSGCKNTQIKQDLSEPRSAHPTRCSGPSFSHDPGMTRIPCGVGEGFDFANETHNITPLMNTALNRRHFLRLAALTPLAAATPSHALTAIPRTGGASFRPGLNAYSFLYQLNANLRWEGGEYSRQHAAETVLSPEELQKNFNDAIKKSLEQEKTGQQRK